MQRINKYKLKENIEKRMNFNLEKCNIGGAVCLVEQAGEVLYQGAFGVKTPGEDVPLQTDAIFRLASMTKPITAVAAMILIERGIISIDDKISKYIPKFANMQISELSENGELLGSHAADNDILIKHLLTHSSGIGTGGTQALPNGGKNAAEKSTLAEAVEEYSRSLLDFEPGTNAEYSPLGAFDVMARIIEIVTEMEYEEFLKKEIFMPCKMINTTFKPSNEQWERIVSMHNKIDGKSVIGSTKAGCIFRNIPMSHKLGGAGLISTIADYRNFATMLMNGGEIFEKRILSEKSVREMSKRQLSLEVNPFGDIWGIGVRVIESETYKRLPVGCFGWSGAFGTHFWVDRVNKIIAIYMKNSEYDGGSGALTAAEFEEDVTNSFEI